MFLIPDDHNDEFTIKIEENKNIHDEQDLMYKDSTGLFCIKGCDESVVFNDLSIPRINYDKTGDLIEESWSSQSFYRDDDCAWRVPNTWLPLCGTAKQRYTGLRSYISGYGAKYCVHHKNDNNDIQDENVIVEISCCMDEMLKKVLDCVTIAEGTTAIASIVYRSEKMMQSCHHQIKVLVMKLSFRDISCSRASYKQLLYLYSIILKKGWAGVYCLEEIKRKSNALLQAWILHLSISMPVRAPVVWMTKFIWRLLNEADSIPSEIINGNGEQLMYATQILLYMVRRLSCIESEFDCVIDINLINNWLTYSMDAFDDGWYRSVAQFFTEMYYCIFGSDICPRRLSRLIAMGVIVSDELNKIFNSASMCNNGICHCQDQFYGEKLKKIKTMTLDFVEYRRNYGRKIALSHVWGQQLILGDYKSQVLNKLLSINDDIWIDIYCPNDFTPDDFKKQYEGCDVLVLDRAIMLGLSLSNIDSIALIASSEWSVRGWTYQESRMAKQISFVSELDNEFHKYNFNSLKSKSAFRLVYAKKVLGLSAENTMQDYSLLHTRAWRYSSDANICENMFNNAMNHNNLTWWQFYASLISKTKNDTNKCWFGGNVDCGERVSLSCQCRKCSDNNVEMRCRIPHSSGAIKLTCDSLEVKGVLLSINFSNYNIGIYNSRVKIKNHYLPVIVSLDRVLQSGEKIYAMFPKLCSNKCPCTSDCTCNHFIQYGYLIIFNKMLNAYKIGTVIIAVAAVEISGPISKILLL